MQTFALVARCVPLVYHRLLRLAKDALIDIFLFILHNCGVLEVFVFEAELSEEVPGSVQTCLRQTRRPLGSACCTLARGIALSWADNLIG